MLNLVLWIYTPEAKGLGGLLPLTAAGAVDREFVYIELGNFFPPTATAKTTTAIQDGARLLLQISKLMQPAMLCWVRIKPGCCAEFVASQSVNAKGVLKGKESRQASKQDPRQQPKSPMKLDVGSKVSEGAQEMWTLLRRSLNASSRGWRHGQPRGALSL